MKNSQMKILFLFLLLTAAVTPLFAADIVPSGMKNVADAVLDFFTGGIMITIETCCVIGCAIAYAYSKNNDNMKKSMIAIGVSIIVIGVASQLVKAIMDAAK